MFSWMYTRTRVCVCMFDKELLDSMWSVIQILHCLLKQVISDY